MIKYPNFTLLLAILLILFSAELKSATPPSGNSTKNSPVSSRISGRQIALRFDDFILRMDSMEINNVLDPEVSLSESPVIELGVGSKIQGTKIQIQVGEGWEVTVFQRYETSVSISKSEGGHRDLIDWKHYDSPWEEMDSLSDGFLVREYTAEEKNRFPEVKVSEVWEYTHQVWGENWAKGWENVPGEAKTVHEAPLSVGLSRILFRVELINSKSGEKKKQFIEVLIPMGC